MSTVVFSIILPTYNRAELIGNAISSVLTQTFNEWEIIVIDDGSTDNTAVIVASFNEKRIKYIKQVNLERSAARNKGIHTAKGLYLCFLDSDDYFLPNHLSNLYQVIEEKKFPEAVFMTGLECRDKQGNVLSAIKPLPEKERLHIYILENFLTVNSQSLAVHRNIFSGHEFDPRFNLWEDTHLWLRALSEYPLFQVPGYTAILVKHDDSGVTAGMQNIHLSNVRKYRDAVNDIFANYRHIFNGKEQLQTNYLDAKYRMYLYQARQNRQEFVAFGIWWMAFKNKPSLYLSSELLKISMNVAGIGLNKKS